MSGPIVRTGTTPEFWENYDRIFGDKSKKKKTGTKASGKKKTAKKSTKKAAKKSTKKRTKKKS